MVKILQRVPPSGTFHPEKVLKIVDADGNVISGDVGTIRIGTDLVASLIGPGEVLLDQAAPENVVHVRTIDNFPNPLTSGKYELYAPIVTTREQLIVDGADIEIVSTATGLNTYTFIGDGIAFASAPGAEILRFSLHDTRVFAAQIAATLFDITFTENFSILQLDNVQGVGFGNPGEIRSAQVAIVQSLSLGAQTSALTLRDVAVIGFTTATFIGSGFTPEAMLRILGERTSDVNLTRCRFATGPAASVIFVEPTIASDATVRMIDVENVGQGSYFEAGLTGLITLFTDATVAPTAITSVTPSAGLARFNFTPGPTLSVGQEVDVTGYVTNPAYNQTDAEITATGAGYFETGIAFGSAEGGGSFTSDSVIVDSAAHGLGDGQSLLIANTIDYGAGYEIYDAGINDFRINAKFETPEISGTWDTGSLTQTEVRMRLRDNGDQANSRTIGSLVVVGNTTATTIANIDEWTSLNLGGIAKPGSNIEGVTLIDPTTGALRLDETVPFGGQYLLTFSSISAGGAQEFQFRITKNSLPFADMVVIANELAGTTKSTTLIAPVKGVQGDEFAVETQNVSGSANITFQFLSGELVL